MSKSTPRRRLSAAVTSAALVLASGLLMTGRSAAATTDPTPSPLELANAKVSRSAATQGMVLLENIDQALPMATQGTVALFGVGSIYTVTGGTGSGSVNNRHTVSVVEGFQNAGYRVTTSAAYSDAVKAAYQAKYAGSENAVLKPTIDYASLEQALTKQTVAPTAKTDTAVFMVARNSGEATDRTATKGDYLLTDTELADVQLIGKTYRNVVIVLNVGGVVDTRFFAQTNQTVRDPRGGQALDALLLMSQAGQESGNALVDVLNGTVTPSGKLTDTWASQYKYYPAAATFAGNDGNALDENYSEGIYVGYRYFDSFYKSINRADPASVVSYPFGYGGSYTTFAISKVKVQADMDQVTVTARVTNTGKKFSGRDVVQVYFSAPQPGLDKPYQELGGFTKTDVLKPGQYQDVQVGFKTTEMASYDQNRSRWVMDAGAYAIRVGDSSRNTHIAAKVMLKKRTVTEKLSSQLVDDGQLTNALSSSPTNFYTYRGEKVEFQRARVVPLNTKHFKAPNNASTLDQDVAIDKTSPLYTIDGSMISSTTAYLDKNQTNWENTGQPYQARDGESIEYVTTNPKTTLYDVAAGRATMQQFVAGLSLRQLATIVEGSAKAGSTLTAVGAAGYTTPLYESQGIPGMTLADGPAGLRLTQVVKSTTPTSYQYCTAFPIGTLLAQTWDPEVVKQVADSIGKEMGAMGATLWLAPGMNIKRDPLNGRNFEYYSEDPFVSGIIATSMVLGVQATPGVGVTIKHYSGNNQETERFYTNDQVTERWMREIYLKGFEMAVKAGQPMAVMTSYNKINHTYAPTNYDLVTDILRGEWGFKGLVMTDWGAALRAGASGTVYSGNDLIEPGNNPAEIMNNTTKMTPNIDVSGLPVYNQTWSILYLIYRWTWDIGSLTLSANGSQTFTTTVDQNTDLSAPKSMVTTVDAVQNATYKQHPPYASVDEAYKEVMHYLSDATNALTAAQRAAITVSNVQHQNPADTSSPVVSYTVTLKGDYPALGYPIRLGDLQRSVMNILNVAMQSAPFGQLAALQGVQGVSIEPYSAQFADLTTYLTQDWGPVTPAKRR